MEFVVTRGNEKYYIQSAFAMNSESKQEQEERPLNAIGDSFKNIIEYPKPISPFYGAVSTS